MSVHEEPWPDGTPAWVDLSVPDVASAREFYSGLLGWEYEGGDEEFGGYLTATVGGRAAAGLGPTQAPGQPSSWTTYLAVTSAQDVADRATAAGGQVVMASTTVGDLGAMAVLVDPGGAQVGLWQSGTHTGADVVNEPGTQIWNELMTQAYRSSLDFYGELFDYTFDELTGGGITYVTVTVAGHDRPVGGIGALPEGAPAPSAWATYFAVADTDASATRAVELGGTVLSPPADSPYGRMAVVRGRFGETFALMSSDEQPSDPRG